MKKHGSNPPGNDSRIGRVSIPQDMVHPMVGNDRGPASGVAWSSAPNGSITAALVIALVACGPTVRPEGPLEKPTPIVRNERPRPPVTSGRHLVIGEMCPQGAAGRPAVAPIVMRTTSWSDAAQELTNLVERGAVPRFFVFGVDGKQAGTFETVGAADIGLSQSVAAGTYLGAPPCTADAGKGQRIEDVKCVPATAGCGLAIGPIARTDDPPEAPEWNTGGACLAGDAIAVDIDGDNAAELFPLASVLDGVRSPSEEWTAGPVAGAACKPTFELFDIRLAPPVEPGKAPDPKHVVKLDLLGVLDLDGDGRRELVIALTFPTVRTIVIYTATGSPQRLELAGEGTSFTR